MANGHHAEAPRPPLSEGQPAEKENFERLVRLETRIEYIATKEDIQKLKVWVLGGVIAAIIIAFTVLKWFPPQSPPT